MVRDTIKDKDYFNDFIDRLKKSQEKRYEKFSKNSIKEDRIPIVKYDMSNNYLRMVIAKYSRGDNMFTSEILTDLHNAIKLLDESWHKNHLGIIPSQKNRGCFLRQYGQSNYIFLIDLLSISILSNIKLKDAIPIIKFIDNDGVEDFLFNFLISSLDENRKPMEKESYEEFFGINEMYGRLKTIIKETDKNIAEKELKYFLENEWYASFKGTPLYNQHNNPHNTYAGYWCFIAAAIVKIKGLDDSSFRDNKYYPKDMLNN